MYINTYECKNINKEDFYKFVLGKENEIANHFLPYGEELYIITFTLNDLCKIFLKDNKPEQLGDVSFVHCPKVYKDNNKYSLETVYSFYSFLPMYITVVGKISLNYTNTLLKNIESTINIYNSVLKMYMFTKDSNTLGEENKHILESYVEKCLYNLNKMYSTNLGQRIEIDVPDLETSFINVNDVLNGAYDIHV